MISVNLQFIEECVRRLSVFPKTDDPLPKKLEEVLARDITIIDGVYFLYPQTVKSISEFSKDYLELIVDETDIEISENGICILNYMDYENEGDSTANEVFRLGVIVTLRLVRKLEELGDFLISFSFSYDEEEQLISNKVAFVKEREGQISWEPPELYLKEAILRVSTKPVT
ncbi:MAG: hypothetical protein AAGU15_04650 [Anaerolineaceae bacterium]